MNARKLTYTYILQYLNTKYLGKGSKKVPEKKKQTSKCTDLHLIHSRLFPTLCSLYLLEFDVKKDASHLP